MPETKLDLKGLACPLPVLRANKAIRILNAGDMLVCDVTDPAAPEDFVNFCDSAGHAMVSCEQSTDFWTVTVRKGG